MANVTPGWGLPDAKPNEPQETGFPWLLVIQILLTILSYLMNRASTKPERDRFLGLYTELSLGRTASARDDRFPSEKAVSTYVEGKFASLGDAKEGADA